MSRRPDTFAQLDRNGWSATISPREPNKPLDRDLKVDWLVVGAGYAGLAAARRIATNCPRESVVLLDGGIIGENASGRNSGFAIDLPHNVGSSLTELDKAHNYLRLCRAGIAHLQEMVRVHQIECEWNQAGRYHCAVSKQATSSVLKSYARELTLLKEEFEWVERDRLAARIGTAYFHAGVYTPGCILLNPAALCHGLARSLPENVQVFESTKVIKLLAGKPSVAFIQGGHRIDAENLVLTCNGDIGALGYLDRKLVTVGTFASLTRPLTDRERTKLGGLDNWGVTPANAVTGATMRLTNDRRLLIRATFSYAPQKQVSVREEIAAQQSHRQMLDARFPSLKGLEFDYFWKGFVAMSRNGAPFWGKLDAHTYAAVGCNGIGIAKQSIAGLLLADFATGKSNPLISDIADLGSPVSYPPTAVLGLAARAMLAKECWVGRAEV